MYKVHFYKDKNGKEPVFEYIQELIRKNDKNSRVKVNKINDYIEILRRFGTMAGEPYIKHLDGEIWELIPLSDRILFVAWHNDSYVLPHHFVKKTRKTPSREIKKAIREFMDLTERSPNYE